VWLVVLRADRLPGCRDWVSSTFLFSYGLYQIALVCFFLLRLASGFCRAIHLWLVIRYWVAFV
jgi:hypothetical protein